MNTQEQFAITVSREIGSGGHTVAIKLAQKLGVQLYDKELIRELEKRFDLTPSTIEALKGEKKHWMSDFIHRVVPAPTPAAFIGSTRLYGKEYVIQPTTDEIFMAEQDIVRSLVEDGSCVIAGRSGFFVLKDYPNKLDIFITAPVERRIARVMQKQSLSRHQAEEVIERVDKMRENYIQRYTGRSRYDARNYHLCLNVGDMSEDEAVEVIMAYIKRG